jgi:hypothetical protein
MPVCGKHGKPNQGFPPFPPPLEIAQNRRDSHIPTASTTMFSFRTGPKNLPYNHQARGWARLNRRSGPGIVAKRIVGFLTKERHEGPWHNYQCKQYGKTLPTGTALLEVGKVLYYSFKGEFTRPTGFFFVAPRGINRNLKRLIAKPSEFKRALLDGWDEHCAKGLVEGSVTTLTDDLRAWIEEWDFSVIRPISVDVILTDPDAHPVLYKWFGTDPGPPPEGMVPAEVGDGELSYIRQLLEAYGEREQCEYADHTAVIDHADHGPHLSMQRERFFDADAFLRFYRDNTYSDDIKTLKRDVYHGIFECHRATHADTLTRIDAVMTQAASTQPSGTLGKHARVPVRQGLCHHFVNEGGLKWRKS